MIRLKQKLREHNFGCFSHRLEYGWRNALISQNAYFSRTAPSEAQIAYFSRNTRSVASSRLPFEKYAFRWAKMRISREIRNPMNQIDCGSGITRDDKSSNVLQRPQSKSRAVCRRVRERRVRFSTCDTSRLKRVLASRGSLSRGLQYTFFFAHLSTQTRFCALERNKTLQKSTNFDFAQTSSRVSFEREAIWAKLTGAKMRGIREIRNLADVSKKSSNV